MARKTSQTDDSDSTSTQTNADDSTQQATNTNKRSPWIYVAIIAIVVIVIAVAYYEFSGYVGPSLSSKQILNNASNSSLNQTQALFINDLKKSENVNNLEVTYYSSNATQHIAESSNLTIAISSNQTISSYKMGNYNKTVTTGIVAYTNANNGEVITKNVSSVYYYNTNTTVTCFNDTTYSAGLVTNSSLQCGTGDQGLSYIEETPFTAVNVSSLSYLAFNNTLTYGGVKTIAGRSCDYLIVWPIAPHPQRHEQRWLAFSKADNVPG